MTPTEKVHEIAKRVYVLLLSVDERQRKCFIDQASQICEMAEDYGLALQSCIEKLKTDRTCPAPEGLEKEDQDRIFYKADDVGLSLIHYLPEPINPLPWVIPYILKLREPTGDEIFMSDCFTLAAIHDRVFREPDARLSYEQKLILEQCPAERFKRDKFASCVYQYYSYLNPPMLYSRAESDRRMAAIEKLFGRVQQKLTHKPATLGGGAGNGKSIEAPKTEIALTSEDVIHIKLDDFSNKEVGSRVLLEDLLRDTVRKGIILDESRHGKDQPKTLRKVLRDKGLDEVAKGISREKKKATLKIPANKISVE